MTIQNPDEPITIDDVTTTAAISTPSNKSEGILGLYINYSWQAPTIKKIRSVGSCFYLISISLKKETYA
ncbi:uncharacterized protein OCT59_017823 [Rhizophagus irregularis]|uniref:uncharacterized protein n=1 Tax=Rhizophagus irregularis TaxID=588596 RepID=UPI00332A8D54|nr:hypothetical protein OCT59_017823 [Rhizophagus irregularis]